MFQAELREPQPDRGAGVSRQSAKLFRHSKAERWSNSSEPVTMAEGLNAASITHAGAAEHPVRVSGVKPWSATGTAMAKPDPESPALMEQLMEEMAGKLRGSTFERTRAVRDDHLTYLREHWPSIQLLDGTHPSRSRGSRYPSRTAGLFGVPCVVDRLPFAPCCRFLRLSWRVFRSSASGTLRATVTSTSKNSTLLMASRCRTSDKRVLKLIRAFLKAGVMEDG